MKDNIMPLFSSRKQKKETVEQIRYLHGSDPQRVPLENLISRVFKKYYNTEIKHFYPNLISIESISSESKKAIKAVAGVRCAADEALFSEYYLDQPLETELEALYNKKIARHHIVEVGNLAPANIGQMRWLIASITAFLYSAGFQTVIFTMVPGVYNAFKRMNLPLEFIANADYDKLPSEIKNQWDPQYYQLNPKVFAGDIVAGFDIMKENIYNSNQKLIPLFEKACQLGKEHHYSNVSRGNVA